MQESSGKGNGTLEVFATFREAWQLTKGTKWAIWAPTLILFVIVMVESLGVGMYSSGYRLLGIIVVLIGVYSFVCVLAGLIKTLFSCLQKRDGLPITHFYDFSRALPLLFTCLIIVILTEVPQIIGRISYPIMILNFIYTLLIMTFLYLSPGLAVEKTTSPFEAIKLSFKAVSPQWLKIAGLVFVQSLIISLGLSATSFLLSTSFFIFSTVDAHSRFVLEIVTVIAFLMVIAQVWLYPFVCVVYGSVYHKLVGISVELPKEVLQEALPQKKLTQVALPPTDLSSVVIHIVISGALSLLACLTLLYSPHIIQLMSVYMFVFVVTVFSFAQNSSKLPLAFLIIASVLGGLAIPIWLFVMLISIALMGGGGHISLNGILLELIFMAPLLLGFLIVWGWFCYTRKKYNTALLLTIFPLYCFSVLPLLFTGQYLSFLK